MKKLRSFLDSIHMEYVVKDSCQNVIAKMKMKNIYDWFDVEIEDLSENAFYLEISKVNKPSKMCGCGDKHFISVKEISDCKTHVVCNFRKNGLFFLIPQVNESAIDTWMETKVDAKKIPRENWMYLKK